MKKNEKVRKPKSAIKTLGRLFKYTKGLRIGIFFVVMTIFLASTTKIAGTAFLKIVIDKYIEPMTHDYNSELFSGFVDTLFVIFFIYLTGIISSYVYSRILVSISARTLYNIRSDLFNKMEKLPIKYFDTNKHGELMSLYINDGEAIREMIS